MRRLRSIYYLFIIYLADCVEHFNLLCASTFKIKFSIDTRCNRNTENDEWKTSSQIDQLFKYFAKCLDLLNSLLKFKYFQLW